MSKIPNIIPIEEDELLYSYILRLSKANGFSFVRDFANAYIYPNASESVKQRQVLQYNLYSLFENIWSQVAIDDTGKRDFFIKTGLFPHYSMFMTVDQQKAILDSVFINNGETGHEGTSVDSVIHELKLCPECMKEDAEKKGFIYYHRCHQINGVSVCPKHGMKLRKYAGIRMHELDDDLKLSEIDSLLHGMAYSQFSKELLDGNYDINADVLKKAVTVRLSEKYEDDFDKTDKAFEESSHKSELHGTFKYLWKIIHSEMYIEPEDMVVFLLFLFKDAETLKEYLPEKKPAEAFEDALAVNNCIIIGQYRSDIVELKHSCDYDFCISPEEFIEKWACPSCSGTLKNKAADSITSDFREQVKDLTGDEYSVLSDFTKQNDSVTLRHNKCGNVFTIKARAFLGGQRCPKCHQFLKNDQFIKTVTELSGGQYRIVSQRTKNLFTIEDVSTHKRVDLSESKILQELRRPTPSPILPAEKKKKEPYVKTAVNDIWSWITENIPHGQPIFIDDIKIDGMTYQILKARLSTLCTKKNLIKRIGFGIYAYPEDDFTYEDVIEAKYLMRNGHHIGYPTGESALYYLGMITEKPEGYRLATNLETESNKTGRTTKFFDRPLRIKGSVVLVTDGNWQVLMVLDVCVNLKKYLHGGNEPEARKILRDYVKKNGLKPEDFSEYQDRYTFSYNAVRNLFAEG